MFHERRFDSCLGRMDNEEYKKKLTRTVWHALGYYCCARLRGWDGKAQLERYTRLRDALDRCKEKGSESL